MEAWREELYRDSYLMHRKHKYIAKIKSIGGKAFRYFYNHSEYQKYLDGLRRLTTSGNLFNKAAGDSQYADRVSTFYQNVYANNKYSAKDLGSGSHSNDYGFNEAAQRYGQSLLKNAGAQAAKSKKEYEESKKGKLDSVLKKADEFLSGKKKDILSTKTNREIRQRASQADKDAMNWMDNLSEFRSMKVKDLSDKLFEATGGKIKVDYLVEGPSKYTKKPKLGAVTKTYYNSDGSFAGQTVNKASEYASYNRRSSSKVAQPKGNAVTKRSVRDRASREKNVSSGKVKVVKRKALNRKNRRYRQNEMITINR